MDSSSHGNHEGDKRHRQQQGQKGECDYCTPLIGSWDAYKAGPARFTVQARQNGSYLEDFQLDAEFLPDGVPLPIRSTPHSGAEVGVVVVGFDSVDHRVPQSRA
jgi:hypothetical protein